MCYIFLLLDVFFSIYLVIVGRENVNSFFLGILFYEWLMYNICRCDFVYYKILFIVV